MKIFELTQDLVKEEETQYRKATTLINPSPGNPNKKQIGDFVVVNEMSGIKTGSCSVTCEAHGPAECRLEYFENFVKTQYIHYEKGHYVAPDGSPIAYFRVLPQVSSPSGHVIDEISDVYAQKIIGDFKLYLAVTLSRSDTPASSSSSSASSTEHRSFFDLLKEMVKLVENTEEEIPLRITEGGDGTQQLVKIGTIAIKEKSSNGKVHYDLMFIQSHDDQSKSVRFSSIMESSKIHADCTVCTLNGKRVPALVISAAPNTAQLQGFEEQLQHLKEEGHSVRPTL